MTGEQFILAAVDLDYLSIVIAGLSAIIAGVSALASKSANEKSSQAQQEANEARKEASAALQRIAQVQEQRETERRREQKKAQMCGSLHLHRPGVYALRIRNEGKGEARRVCVFVSDVSFGKTKMAADTNRFPDTFGPSGEQTVYVNQFRPEILGPEPWRLRITWEDDSGDPSSWNGKIRR